MNHVFLLQPLLFLFMMICMTMSHAADLLKNPDFETPPANITSNSTSQFFLLNRENHIPGWSFNGTVWYVTSGANLSFPREGHAVQLGENGKINQTITGIGSDSVRDYVLTFTLGVLNESCNNASVNITVQDRMISDRSMVFSFQRNLSRNLWESYALYLGGLGKGDLVNIEIKSVGLINSVQNVSCWPIVDSFIVKINDLPRWYSDNMLANGGFEIGPAFPKNSSEGLLLTEDPEGKSYNSPLQEWAILGTVKYINSQNYKVPRGKSAIQLLSGNPTGIQLNFFPLAKFTYTLNFTIGDANDSCIGDFIVFLQIGNDVYNFTMRSIGTGSSFRHSLTFKPQESQLQTPAVNIPMIFYSFNETLRSDGVICGPVLDNFVLVGSDGNRTGSYGDRIQLHKALFLFYVLILLMNSLA